MAFVKRGVGSIIPEDGDDLAMDPWDEDDQDDLEQENRKADEKAPEDGSKE